MTETIYWCRCLFCNGTGQHPFFWGSCDLCGGCGKIYAIDPFGPKTTQDSVETQLTEPT